MYKIDLHTHSQASPDGGLNKKHYEQALQKNLLDFIAVTDHNSTELARELQAELGKRIIVGEEISAKEGEIIGLFLKKAIPPHLTAKETIHRIRDQGGLVYIPHPFETVRKGISGATLTHIADEVDIIEVHNGRAVFQNFSEKAKEWSILHQKPGAASSDAHGKIGWGKTYSLIAAEPTSGNLVKLLHEATYEARGVGPLGVAYPTLHRWRKKGRKDHTNGA